MVCWCWLLIFCRRACIHRPFLRSQLQQICEEYFEWSAEKTGILELLNLHACFCWICITTFWCIQNLSDLISLKMSADEYILPKIAERELRKFSNLRSTSSALGMKPLLNVVFDLACWVHFWIDHFCIFFWSIQFADSSTMPCIGDCKAAKSSWRWILWSFMEKYRRVASFSCSRGSH